MGFRFHKSLGLLKGVKLNISKSGVSLSLGRKGVSANIGRGGIKTTVGLPGSGMSYSKQFNVFKRSPLEGGLGLGKIFMICVLVAAVGYVIYVNVI